MVLAIPFRVPQADDLSKVLEVVELIGEGYSTTEDIADEMQLVPRGACYYIAAAKELGMVDPDETNDGLGLTGIGRAYLTVDVPKKRELVRQCFIEMPVVVYMIHELGDTRPNWHKHADKLKDQLFVQDVLERAGYAASTAWRRAFTIKSWVETLED